MPLSFVQSRWESQRETLVAPFLVRAPRVGIACAWEHQWTTTWSSQRSKSLHHPQYFNDHTGLWPPLQALGVPTPHFHLKSLRMAAPANPAQQTTQGEDPQQQLRLQLQRELQRRRLNRFQTTPQRLRRLRALRVRRLAIGKLSSNMCRTRQLALLEPRASLPQHALRPRALLRVRLLVVLLRPLALHDHRNSVARLQHSWELLLLLSFKLRQLLWRRLPLQVAIRSHCRLMRSSLCAVTWVRSPAALQMRLRLQLRFAPSTLAKQVLEAAQARAVRRQAPSARRLKWPARRRHSKQGH